MLDAVISLAAMGGVFGVILGVAGKKFSVETDPRVEALTQILPGVNCGACGFPGCGGFAEAVVAGAAKLNACAPGGAALYAQIAAIMGSEIAYAHEERKVAQLLCQGGYGHVKLLYRYEGIKDCHSVRKKFTGPKACKVGCLQQGSCFPVCPFGAIQMGADGLPVVDYYLCTGCNKCVVECPQQILQLVAVSHLSHVRCVNTQRGKEAKANCSVACIKCKLCEKHCPEDAVHVVAVGAGSLARIDYTKCTNCGICAAKCPTKAIENTPPLSPEAELEAFDTPAAGCQSCGVCKPA